MEWAKKKWIKSRSFEKIHKRKRRIIIWKENLNNLRWYGTKIGEGKKDYFDSVNVVVNYLEKRFDSLSYLINNFIKDENETLNSTSITYIKENNISNELENLDLIINASNEIENLSSNIIIPQLENNQSLKELNGIDSDKVLNKEENNISQILLKINYWAYLFILFFIWICTLL